MALARRACSACAVVLALLLAGSTAPAWAGGAQISILSSDGSVHRAVAARRRDRGGARSALAGWRTAAGARRRDADRRVRAQAARPRPGQITGRERRERLAAYDDAKRAAAKLTGTRRRELSAVIATLRHRRARRADPLAPGAAVADAGAQPRVVDDARRCWPPAQRVGFAGSELV